MLRGRHDVCLKPDDEPLVLDGVCESGALRKTNEIRSSLGLLFPGVLRLVEGTYAVERGLTDVGTWVSADRLAIDHRLEKSEGPSFFLQDPRRLSQDLSRRCAPNVSRQRVLAPPLNVLERVSDRLLLAWVCGQTRLHVLRG